MIMANRKLSTEVANYWWGYVVLLGRFVVLFMDAGIAKSFGVLIPEMVKRLDEDYATVGLICSLPASLLYLVCEYWWELLRANGTHCNSST